MTTKTHFNRIVAIATLTALPLVSEAHPGHDGDHSQSLATLLLLAAAFFAIKRSVGVARMKLQRRTAESLGAGTRIEVSLPKPEMLVLY